MKLCNEIIFALLFLFQISVLRADSEGGKRGKDELLPTDDGKLNSLFIVPIYFLQT